MRVAIVFFVAQLWNANVAAQGFLHNANFRVFTPSIAGQGEDEFAARLIARAAQYRSAISKDWFGQSLPDGAGRTIINVSFDEKRDTGLTWARDDQRRQFHALYLTTSPERALGSTLAHEMAHVVLATWHPHPHRLAAWLEEGIASRYDNAGRVAIRRRIVAECVASRRWPDVARVMRADNIAATDRRAYAASASLVSYLLTRGDRETLIAFGADQVRRGTRAALAKHYGIDSVNDLQRRWEAWTGSAQQFAGRTAASLR